LPIKNYTTEVDAAKTCGEISGMLAAKGARRVQMDYDETQQPCAISFVYPLHGIPVFFQLPCNIDGVLKCLRSQKGVPYSAQNKDQARRVGWRILKNWLEAQLAIVEAGAAQMAEVFLPYAIHKDGKTMFALFDEQYTQLALNSAPAEEVESTR
jgi:hypothetical protein